ncbi:hypothetical protein BDM02DRAFT_3271343 [Thelephora ganbajun]|uniref:Uncharacterized protein n=1 Tax=Thelephora ganbajun TaxID=370292 RepID=A0ACB6Z8Q2_THEGA|nr:hypothetical protein BDM02DRAFT_3271343 [Thelephora ganbajun]
MTTEWDGWAHTINIFEIGSILTKIEYIRIRGDYFAIRSFSQTTHRIFGSASSRLVILDVRDSHYLLEEDAFPVYSQCFSSDGSLFAASGKRSFCIWKYTSDLYVRWREFSIPELTSTYEHDFLRFSPTSSLLLGCPNGILKLWRLDCPSIDARLDGRVQLIVLSRHGGYIVAGHQGDSTVTITSLLSQTPLCVIDTDMATMALTVTGNILLALGDDTIAAWRLTEEGVVYGVSSGGRAGRGNSIWTIPVLSGWPSLSFRDQTMVIEHGEKDIHVYHTETGEVLEPVQAILHSSLHPWGTPQNVVSRLCKYGWNTPSEGGGPFSWNTIREGWVKDLEGKHLLWLPIEWRNPLYVTARSCDSTALALGPRGGGIVVIKF